MASTPTRRARLLAALTALLLALAPVASGGAALAQIVATALSPDEIAIQQLIEHANDEQARAIAAHDSSLMADTSTPAHYEELVRINQSLLDNGVVRIELNRLDWGRITVSGASATAITWETWSTSYANGLTEVTRDQNSYQLVREDGTWKIAGDGHADGSSGPTVPTAPPRPPVPLVPPSEGRSRNWSGYQASGGAFTAVTGTWTVPQLQPNGSFGASAAWVGIGGVSSRDLIQAGTQELVSPSGRVRYQAWTETLPQAARSVPLTVAPGDSVTVSISEDPDTPNLWHISFTNNTSGQAFDKDVSYSSTHSSAEWVEEAPSAGRATAVLPLANFGALDFTDASAVRDGAKVTVGDANAHPITMVDEAGRALAVPTALGEDGASFTINRAAAADEG
jgi:Peptidase A4 family